MDVVAVVIVVVINVVAVPLLVVAHANNIQLWSINIHLRLLKADVKFLWWVVW